MSPKRHRLISGVLLCGALVVPGAVMSDAPEAVLRYEAKIVAPVVRAGDLLQGLGPESAALPMFSAPRPGYSAFVSIEQIEDRARRMGLPEVDFQGRSGLWLTRTGRRITEEAMGEVLREALAAYFVLLDNESLEIVFDAPLVPREVEHDARAPLALHDLSVEAQSGRFAARFDISDSKEIKQDLWRATGSARVIQRVIGLRRALSSGSPITASDLVHLNLERGRLPGGSPFVHARSLEEMVLTRNVAARTPLTESDVRPAHVVHKGDLVRLEFRSGALTISASAQALHSAAQGERVQLLNRASTTIIEARAIGEGLAVPLPTFATSKTQALLSEGL